MLTLLHSVMSQLWDSSRTFHARVYLIIFYAESFFVSQVIESFESIVELLLLCCLSLAVASPDSRQQVSLGQADARCACKSDGHK